MGTPAGQTVCDANDQLTFLDGPEGPETFDYDPNGNQIANNRFGMTYDAAGNRLSAFLFGLPRAGFQSVYSYDGYGNQVTNNRFALAERSSRFLPPDHPIAFVTVAFEGRPRRLFRSLPDIVVLVATSTEIAILESRGMGYPWLEPEMDVVPLGPIDSLPIRDTAVLLDETEKRLDIGRHRLYVSSTLDDARDFVSYCKRMRKPAAR